VSRFRPLSNAFYVRPADIVAPELLGRYLVRELDGERTVARLVEVEAYLGADDPASHAFRGRTARNAAMFLAGGHAYVYFVYGMHFCLNVVTGESGVAHAVLLRAAEVVEGVETAAQRRGVSADAAPRLLAGGPARLCEALGVDRAFDGASLRRGELTLREGEPVTPPAIARGRRVGVAYAGRAAAWPLRFAVRASPALSRPLAAR
jgi:DNA-3-methyladenine glycosylase